MKTFLTRVRSIAIKEFRHIVRDPFTLAVALALPIIFVGFFGFIIDLDYKHMRINVRDNDMSMESRRFLYIFSASGYFDVTPVHTPLEADQSLERNIFPGLMIIEKDFGKRIKMADPDRPAKVQLMIDGSDNGKAGIMIQYVNGIVQEAAKVFADKSAPPQQGLSADLVRTRFLFNPELNSHWFVVPALSTIIIGLLAILLTALTVAKEWENGSMELLLSTPVNPMEIVVGKLAPYFVLSFFNILLVFAIAVLVFKIPFVGSFLLYLIACTIYILGSLALGILISIATRSQQAAIQFAFAIGLLPAFVFSGFIFPIENMPVFFRAFTFIFPQRWFLQASRSLFLSVDSFNALAMPFLCLIIFSTLMVFMSVKRFKTDVEP
ncbi:ABC-2 type transport system permease protein [Elusimicrobium simillimum]|uniref:ABC transporter permease n=1 Tax=Elusimicrobium simillimum TaxID=3143438 RepID=UPI003C6FE00E